MPRRSLLAHANSNEYTYDGVRAKRSRQPELKFHPHCSPAECPSHVSQIYWGWLWNLHWRIVVNTENFIFRPWLHACIISCMHAQCFRVCCYFCYFCHLTGEELLRANGLGTPKFRCWSPNLWYLRIWLFEGRSLEGVTESKWGH